MWVTEPLSDVVIASDFAFAISYFVEVLSGVVVEALAVDVGVKVLARANINVSAAVMIALEFPMSIP